MRTYLFGALVGRAAGVRVDEELLFRACAMHDLGLTDRFMGELPFEIQGAIAARRLLIEHGMSVERASIVWDAIAMHPLAIADHKPPEIRLVAAGAAADVVGAGLDGLAAFEVAAVVHAFPRLDMKRAFVKSCGDVVAKYPRGAARTFMRDIGEREVPGYHPSNICDAIQRAPFDS